MDELFEDNIGTRPEVSYWIKYKKIYDSSFYACKITTSMHVYMDNIIFNKAVEEFKTIDNYVVSGKRIMDIINKVNDYIKENDNAHYNEYHFDFYDDSISFEFNSINPLLIQFIKVYGYIPESNVQKFD